MNVMIEFYSTRDSDDVHAVGGRETLEARDIDDAIEGSRLLSRTLEMPQQHDAMTITDILGASLFSGIIDVDVTNNERPRS